MCAGPPITANRKLNEPKGLKARQPPVRTGNLTFCRLSLCSRTEPRYRLACTAHYKLLGMSHGGAIQSNSSTLRPLCESKILTSDAAAEISPW